MLVFVVSVPRPWWDDETHRTSMQRICGQAIDERTPHRYLLRRRRVLFFNE